VNLKLRSASGVTPRKFRLHVPSSYRKGKPVPLILSFHGRGKKAKSQEALSYFSNASYGFEGIVVYPEGVPVCSVFSQSSSIVLTSPQNAKGTQQYQGDPDSPPSINDVKFTLELLDHIEATYCIDTSRMYAAGKSNGGGFTGVLACDSDATKRIAAFAPVSGAFYLNAEQNAPPCNPSRKPVPIMEFHGFEDATIPYAGGINTRGNANSTDVVTWVNDWAKRDGFEVAANKTTHLCKGGKKVTKHSWNDVVVHYNYTNLGHDWPSSYENGDTKGDEDVRTCEDAEATPIILDWFKKWTL
jgi:poly(3-hydroxybutyrate) depolymerase